MISGTCFRLFILPLIIDTVCCNFIIAYLFWGIFVDVWCGLIDGWCVFICVRLFLLNLQYCLVGFGHFLYCRFILVIDSFAMFLLSPDILLNRYLFIDVDTFVLFNISLFMFDLFLLLLCLYVFETCLLNIDTYVVMFDILFWVFILLFLVSFDIFINRYS